MTWVRRGVASVAVSVVAVLVLAGCGSDATGSSGRPVVVATTPILGDIVSSTLGDAAEVVVLMPRGADPHAFQPSARQLGELRDASLVVANGLGLERGLHDALDAAAADGVNVLEVAPLLEPIAFAGDHGHDEADHDESEHDHDHGDLDPHVWFDPSRMALAVGLIADAFVDAAPDADRDAVLATADAYAAELTALDAEVEETLATVPEDERILVTNHDTFGYLADRYGFEVLGVVIPGGDTLAAPSASALDELADEIARHGVRAVFTDEGVSPDLARALAGEVGGDVQVVALFTDTLGAPDGPSGTYVDLIRTDARRIADALG